MSRKGIFPTADHYLFFWTQKSIAIILYWLMLVPWGRMGYSRRTAAGRGKPWLKVSFYSHFHVSFYQLYWPWTWLLLLLKIYSGKSLRDVNETEQTNAEQSGNHNNAHRLIVVLDTRYGHYQVSKWDAKFWGKLESCLIPLLAHDYIDSPCQPRPF